MANIQKSLRARNSELASAEHQVDLLERRSVHPPFSERLKGIGLYPLMPTGATILQINIGKMCNQTCAHCHVDAGPDRKEIMTRETMEQCLNLAGDSSIEVVDITGGAPEMNPDFKWFVSRLKEINKHIIVRCNLTIIVANKKYNDLPHFYKDHGVEIVSSLPFYNADRTDRQRGEGVFRNSIQALQMLNAVGYGKQDTGLLLNLVYNPSGAFLPASQLQLEGDFKRELKNHYDIDFNNLYCITNMPISRYLDYLLQSGNYENYMDKLVRAFNPSAAFGVMCRNTISVSWDGFLYDCDFNQMLDLPVNSESKHVSNFNLTELNERSIVVNQHCYGCTAGAGSSCGGTTI
ncbi:MAG TPA: arsenosugar biosynthesis radical SAM (seleno)protein ArsS [Ohtaekwangia sp.]|nr:arsenosugar biosynthesis radical SAM (seleno)protein ArsS [Ohtaekwangia sp.]